MFARQVLGLAAPARTATMGLTTGLRRPMPCRRIASSFSAVSASASFSSSSSSSSTSPYPPYPSYPPPQPQPQPQPSFSQKKSNRRLVYLLTTLMGAYWAYSTVEPYFEALTYETPPRGSVEEHACNNLVALFAENHPRMLEVLDDPDWEEWRRDGTEVSRGDLEELSSPSSSSSSSSPSHVRLPDGPRCFGGMTGYHRIFRNRRTHEIRSFVHLGPDLCGWPLVVHGGALATLLDDSLGRCAIFNLPARTGVTARLELTYRSMARAPGVYVVSCLPEFPDDKQPDADGQAHPNLNKLWCSATLSDLRDGIVCVKARALFVVPRGYQLGRVNERF